MPRNYYKVANNRESKEVLEGMLHLSESMITSRNEDAQLREEGMEDILPRQLTEDRRRKYKQLWEEAIADIRRHPMEDRKKEAIHPLEPMEGKKDHLQHLRSNPHKTEDIQPMETTEPNKIRDMIAHIVVKILIIRCLILLNMD